MTTRIRKVVDWIVGLTLIAVGIIGGFIPVMQGWIFVLAGLAVLSSHSTIAHGIHERVKTWGRQVKEKLSRHDR